MLLENSSYQQKEDKLWLLLHRDLLVLGQHFLFFVLKHPIMFCFPIPCALVNRDCILANKSLFLLKILDCSQRSYRGHLTPHSTFFPETFHSFQKLLGWRQFAGQRKDCVKQVIYMHARSHYMSLR